MNMENRGLLTRKWLIIFGVAAIALLCAIVIYNSLDAKRLQSQMELGQKYLEELDYKQAVIAFENVIAIDAKNVEAYLGLAETYMGMKNAEKAEEVLEQGAESTGDARIIEVLERLKDMKEAERQSDSEAKDNLDSEQDISRVNELTETDAVTAMYQQYYDKLVELRNQYGICEDITEDVEDDPWMENNRYLKGLCFAKMIDFNVDGMEEMLLAYRTGADPEYLATQNYVVEVWAWQGTSIQKVYAGEPIGDVDHGIDIYVNLYEGNYYLYYGAEEYDEETSAYQLVDEWYGYSNDAFGLCKRNVYSEGADAAAYKIDGAEVTEAEWSESRNQWREANEDYGLQNAGFAMDTSMDELIITFHTLSDHLGIEWVDSISREKEEKPYSNSLWGTYLIGYWETLFAESFGERVETTFYEDGTAEVHTRSGVCFGSFQIEADGNVTICLNDGYLYSNTEARWTHEAVDSQVKLTEGSHIFEAEGSFIGGDDGVGFPASFTLTRVDDTDADYSSADESIQYYKSLVSD